MDNKFDVYNSSKLLFEFIVDQQQFIKQISTENGKINLDLISQFLNQFLSSSKDFYNNEEIMDLDLLETSIENEYKLKVLKNLAIKIASYIKFDLDILHSGLNVVILNTLLIEFFKLFCDENLSTADDINFQILSPSALFAVSLYHRWCLKLIVEDGLLKKPPKVPNIQYPIDNNAIGTKESIIKKIKERQHISINILEKFLNHRPTVCVTQSECIIFDESQTLKYDWSKAFEIKQNEHLSLIAYDLGCAYFFNRKFDQAYASFNITNEMIQRSASAFLSRPDFASLQGYLKTCSSIHANHHPPQTILEKVHESLRNNFMGLTGLLLEDIIRRELDLPLRVCLQEQAMNAKRQDSLYEEIVVCNAIRESLEGRVVCLKLINILTITKGIIDFFLKVCVDVYLCISDSERQNLKLFLKFLSSTLPSDLNFVPLMLASPLNEMFTNNDFADDCKVEIIILSTAPLVSPLFDTNSEEEYLFNCELELLNTFEVEKINAILNKIQPRHRDYYFKSISSKLVFSNDWSFWFDNLPNMHPTFKLLIQILIHKSSICYRRKDFGTSWDLLQYLDLQMCQSIENSAVYLKRIRLEILRVGLSAANQKPPIFMTGSSAQDLAYKCKFFLMNFDYDVANSDEILCKIIAFLVNNNEFQFIISLSTFNNNVIQLGVKLSTVLQDLGQINVIRSMPKELILQLRDICCLTPSAPDLVHQFIENIRSEIVFTLLISAFAKLYIISDDNVSYQIFTEFSTIWPTTLPVDKKIILNPAIIFNILNDLIISALNLNSRQLSWIRSRADLLYIKKEFDGALKFYIQLLTIITNYFCELIPNNAVTDSVIKKMINCCNQVGYNTQSAVLCQFLEEIDYTTLFSNLQAKQTCDAMDEYYQFFWDISILEFLVNLHSKRGEVGKKNYCMKLIGELELNSSNPYEIAAEASRMRKMRFMRCLAKQFLTQPAHLLAIDVL